ncbi:MAG: nucleotidyl transferase AbiEii/AbiGii toxin family protein [Helicobacter sp.]|nr:nucleotidyl transferase AbiEii/AbiGii toxin family protein [Helicobacter sp.]
MKLQLEILPKEQLAIYPHLKTITDMDFTLFGGTAIALQLGHRKSIDFDFFTARDISHLHTKLLNLENIKVAQITQQNKDTLIFQTNNGVRLSFFGTLGFVNSVNKIYSEDKILKLADLTALLTTKLKATCDRAEYKDYIDIITILKTNQTSLEEGLRQIKNYFGNKFPLINIVKGLTYFEDGDLHRLSKEDKEFLCKKVNKLDFNKIEA